jgi:hypothetical protein
MEREDALDPDAKARLAHGDGLAHARVLARYDHSFESLEPLFIAFFDSHVNANRIAGLELG